MIKLNNDQSFYKKNGYLIKNQLISSKEIKKLNADVLFTGFKAVDENKNLIYKVTPPKELFLNT